MTDLLTCHYCSKELYPGDVTKDHIVPRALGGQDVRWNITWACRDCNSRKADNWPTHNCNKCRKTRRIHWESFNISEFKNAQTKRNATRA